MRRVRVVLCVVSVTATSAASAGPATAGLNPNSVLEPSLTGSKSVVVVQGLKNGYGGYGGDQSSLAVK
jgi:hypothetical protein